MPLTLEAVATVETEILYDSGWVDLRGDSTTQLIESFNFDEDAVIYLFGVTYINTQGSYWILNIPNSYNSNVAAISSWENLHSQGDSKTYTSAFRAGSLYALADNSNPVVSQAKEANNISGFVLTKGRTAEFKSSASANTGHGITYRAIVTKQTSNNLLARVK